MLPLWADHLGVDAATASALFELGAAVDVVCSYPAGRLMDALGRRIVAVPSLLVMGVAYLAMPLATGVASLAVLAVVMGVGNGLGNGVIMTLGADVAPPRTRAEFLGAWRLTHDAGLFAGPLLVGSIARERPVASMKSNPASIVSWTLRPPARFSSSASFALTFTAAGTPKSSAKA